ncbi:MAG TPA: hypothetical protein VMY76_00520 [Gemmatimonadales bacterium]|nr:hypothetical protein [Gemmatimonadales bacterium]
MARRALFMLALCLVVAAPAAAQEADIQAQVHGLILVNAFANGEAFNNSDVPQFLLPSAAGGSQPAAGATIRQSRVSVSGLVPEFAGGRLAGEIDVDFFGGQQPSTGGRTFPLLRLRRAFVELTRRRLTLFVGQEAPPILEINPSSLASIGIPEFAGAGNLWLWIPQIRVGATVATSGAVRVGLELAALAPTSGDPQTAFFTQPDVAERTSRPYLQSRIRARWGDGDTQGEVNVGGHYGWLRVGAERIASRAVAVSVWTPLVRGLELRGEGYTGMALAGLGGGGIGQSFGRDSVAVATTGGWVQLNARPAAGWEIGAGLAMDDPDDGDLVTSTQRLRNLSYEGHAHWRMAPLVLGAEVRRVETRYGGETISGTHANVAFGFEF